MNAFSVNTAVYDAVLDVARKIARPNLGESVLLDGQEMTVKEIMGVLERKDAGTLFTQDVSARLEPVTAALSKKDVSAIDAVYPGIGVLLAKLTDTDEIFSSLNMILMLINTLRLIPQEMIGTIETMTQSLMNGKAGGFNDLFKNFGSFADMNEGFSDQQGQASAPAAVPMLTDTKKKRKKSKASDKQSEFRDKLC